MSQGHHLAAILFTDIEGYTSLMQEDETKALAAVRQHNRAIEEHSKSHGGEVANFYGDGCLVVFPSATEAAQCALDIQKDMRKEPAVPLRIGIHIGEIFEEEGKVMGDGVNLASRIQSLGVANSILVSEGIYSQIKNQLDFKAISLGSFHFKNVAVPMEVYAMANEGLVIPDKNSMQGKVASKKNSGKKWMIAAGIMLLVLVGYFIYPKLTAFQNEAPLEKSIAVLPFVDMSATKDLEYFGDGMAEEIISVLAQANDLKVIARTSSFQFKGKEEDMRKIGETLGVAAILEGSVRKSNDMLRVTAQLIKASDGTHLWSKTFNIAAADVFEVQDEIAFTVVKALKIRLSDSLPSTFVASRNKEAYELYQQGRYFYDRWGNEDIPKALELFKLSVHLDSTQAIVWAYLASTQLFSGKEQYREALAKSLAIDPHQPVANIIQARSFANECKFERSLQSVENALKLGEQNNPIVLRLAGQLMSGWGNHRQAIQLCEKSIEIDPLIANGYHQLGIAYFNSRNYEKAVSAFKRCLYISNAHPDAQYGLALVYIMLEKPDSAIMVITPITSKIRKEKISVLAEFSMHHTQEFERRLKLFETTYRNTVARFEIYAFTGKKKEALTLLSEFQNKCIINNQFEIGIMADIPVNPLLDKLRSEEKFQEIVESLNFPKF